MKFVLSSHFLKPMLINTIYKMFFLAILKRGFSVHKYYYKSGGKRRCFYWEFVTLSFFQLQFNGNGHFFFDSLYTHVSSPGLD